MSAIEASIERLVARGNQQRQHVAIPRDARVIDKVVARPQTSITDVETGATTITEPSRQIPVLTRCQVLVIGGGPAGLSAALGSARAGADTVLAERYGCFGGVISTVGVETIAWYRYEGCVDSQGIGLEMERQAARLGGSHKFPYNDSECLDADFFKVVADQMITEAGVRPLLHTFVVEALLDVAGRVIGVVTESKSGRMAILCDRVVDCSGDADVAWLAGAPCRVVEAKADAMGVTTILNCSGIDREKFLKYAAEKKATYNDWGESWTQACSEKEKGLESPYLQDEFEQARKDGVIPADVKDICGSWSSITKAGEATNLNIVHMKGIDALNVLDLTRGEMMGRERAMHAIRALKHTVPGFENCKLRNFGMTLGVRDTRKIVGEYELTAEDVMCEARFPDSLGIFPEFIDGYSILILPTSGRYFEIPYRCLMPKNVDNLLVGGRCIAGDRTSHAAMRNMMACTVSGQAAGVAAAVSILNKQSTREIDVELIQTELKRQAVKIH